MVGAQGGWQPHMHRHITSQPLHTPEPAFRPPVVRAVVLRGGACRLRGGAVVVVQLWWVQLWWCSCGGAVVVVA